MKSIFTILMVALIAVMVAVPTMSADEEKKAETKTELPEGYVAQTTCPVMGGKITSESFTDYQGQRIYFCCAGCEGSFLKDPDKYFEQAAKDKVMFENVQTTCPVTGNPIDKKFFTYYKGRGIYFCCADCIEKFNADPEMYLKKMGEAEEKAHEDHEDHEGHDHEGHEGHDHDHDHDHGH